ncbi:MAG TPA: FAD-dependent oxidoreductase, partial [Allosphingosinicella sp.]|nr:FAD-dependent oxidoreductase [Allosphingosinicella sp.]
MARHISYWTATAPASGFPRLTGDIEADVAVIGAGIVGVTTARMLKDRGLKVALVEARGVGEEVTGKSTAKVTSQHNMALTTIARKFGEDGARIYAEANEAGLAAIVRLAEEHGIACDLERKPAFTYTLDESEVGRIEAEAEAARRFGLPASLTRDTGLPFPVLAAMRWDDQAQFHPVRYVKGLAATLPGGGCHVFERSRVIDWDPRRIATDAGSVRARHVVMATHLPLGQTGLFFAENFPHTHAVIMGRAERARVPEGMYLSVET